MASAISRSQSQSTVGTLQHDVISRVKKGIDFMFPIYEEMVKRVQISNIFHYITLIITSVQFLLQCVWPYSMFNYNSDSKFSNIIAQITKIVFFFDPNDKLVIPKIPIIVEICTFIICFGFIIIEIAHYRMTISFNKYLLFVYRILLECILPIFIIPSQTVSACLLAGSLNNSWSKVFIIYSALAFIPSATFLAAVIVHYTMVSASPYLQRSPFTAIYYKTPIYIWSVVYAWQFLQIIIVIFPAWSSVVISLIHAIVLIFMIRWLCFLPFLWEPMNIIYCSLITGGIASDIVSCVQVFYFVDRGLPIYLMLAVIVISAIIYHYSFNATKKKAKANLECFDIDEDGGEASIKAFYNKFDEMGLNYSPRLLLFYIQIAVETGSKCLIPSGAILMYAFEKYQDHNLYNQIAVYSSLLPCFSKIMGIVFKHLFDKKDLSFADRFLIFTVMKIKILRQSSVSAQFSDDIINVRQETKKCKDIIKGFMTNVPNYVSFFNSFYNTITSANNHWIEFTTHFPNSSKAYDEYADFLVDVMTDFKLSTIQKHKMALIDDGNRLHRDMAYISFIHWWPFYLKKYITDTHGHLLNNKGKKTSSQSNSRGHSSSSTFTSIDQLMEIPPEEEDLYAKSLFNQHKLRLAYQRALEGIDIKYSIKYKICALVVTIMAVISLALMNIIYGDYFKNRALQITEVKHINYAHFYISHTRFVSYLYYFEATDLFELGDYYDELVADDPKDAHYIDFKGDLIKQSMELNTRSNEHFNRFIDSLVKDSIGGIDIYGFASIFLTQGINMTYCAGSPPMPIARQNPTSLKAMFSFMSIALRRLFADDASMWINSPEVCTIVNNIDDMSEAFHSYIKSINHEEQIISAKDKDFIGTFEIYLPTFLLIACLIIILVPMTLYYFDLKKLLSVFANIPLKTREIISETIRKGIVEENTSTATLQSTSIMCQLFTIVIISTFITPLILFFCLGYAQIINTKFEMITNWMNIGGSRSSALSESIEHLTLGILAKNGLLGCISADHEFAESKKLIKDFARFHSETTDGTNSFEACNNFDDELDELHFGTDCVSNESTVTTHERYRCTSLSQDASFVKSFIDEALAKITTITRCDSPEILNIYHIANTHMYNKLYRAAERFNELGVAYEKKFMQVSSFLMWVGIVLQAIVCIIYITIGIKLDNMYHAGLVLMRRISPSLLVQNHEIMDLITNKQKKESSEAMTFSQNIIFSSTDGVLFLNKNGIIEMVNNSINDIIGYVPDQILGQNISLIFNEASSVKVVQQIDMMKNNEAKDIFEDHLECISDDASLLQCYVTILGLTNPGQSDISIFVMFIRDESILLKKQEDAELAKKQSEKLLYEILPRDIIFKLNQGETDITFAVPHATIMFIDIVRFSDYAANLTPQQIMGNLSLIFDSFDKHLTDFDLITKIKLIGDVYMCASGLFMPSDSNPQDHAVQMIKFGLECLQDIDNINIQLESMLSVRIGINTGGPVIGGVLGTDKPVFDIIGDPINVSSRLQSTDIPGKIQIPQSTYDLVHTLDFSIEKRGEVYLKGKGNVTTYLISPLNVFSMTTNTLSTSLLVTK